MLPPVCGSGLRTAVGFLQRESFRTIQYEGRDLNISSGSTISSAADGTVFIASDGNLFAAAQSQSGTGWVVRRIAVHGEAGPASMLKVQSVFAQPDGALFLGCGKGILQTRRNAI